MERPAELLADEHFVRRVSIKELLRRTGLARNTRALAFRLATSARVGRDFGEKEVQDRRAVASQNCIRACAGA